MSSIFSISLDFELHWGGFEKWPLEKVELKLRRPNAVSLSYNKYFLNTREVIPQMLSLFHQYEIHVTWATVGMLFHHSHEELLQNAPKLKPAFKIKKLSAYNYISEKGIGLNEAEDPFHFAPSLIEKIIETPFQELASHTYSHYYCNEAGQTSQEFREDIRAAQRAAIRFGAPLKSLVFPRNQFNEEYLRVCFEEGVTSVRSNPLDWFWQIESTEEESRWKRLNRGLDAYLPIGKKNTYKLTDISVSPGLPICLPASRLLRPYNPRELFLNSMKVSRIKKEIERAAHAKEVYHLWWHPHNFGNYPQQSLKALKEILECYVHCRKNFGMCSMNMGEISEALISRHVVPLNQTFKGC